MPPRALNMSLHDRYVRRGDHRSSWDHRWRLGGSLKRIPKLRAWAGLGAGRRRHDVQSGAMNVCGAARRTYPKGQPGRKGSQESKVAMRIEDYALIGDTEVGALVGKERVHRLVVRATVRFSRVFRGAARYRCQRPLADRARGSGASRAAAVPAGHAGPGDRLRDGRWRCSAGRLHATCRRAQRHRPHRRGPAGPGSYADGTQPEVRLRKAIPALGRMDQGIFAVAGPDAVCLRTPVDIDTAEGSGTATFTVAEGERVPFHLSWYPSHTPRPEPIDAFNTMARTESWWREWSARCTYEGPHRRTCCGRSLR